MGEIWWLGLRHNCIKTWLSYIQFFGLNQHHCWWSFFSSLSLLLDYLNPECHKVKQFKHHFQLLQYHLNILPLVNTSSHFKNLFCSPHYPHSPHSNSRGTEEWGVLGKTMSKIMQAQLQLPCPRCTVPPNLLFHSGKNQTRKIKSIF